ncbi:hypothetical protein BT93_C1383 [Corymbia citriodora subsp. variegata]|nr:hypothetical protein BT93_C1383 [Corymbia citriodora subsp. variegata]
MDRRHYLIKDASLELLVRRKTKISDDGIRGKKFEIFCEIFLRKRNGAKESAEIHRELEVPFSSRKGWNIRKSNEEPATPIPSYPKRVLFRWSSEPAGRRRLSYPRARTMRGLWAAHWRSLGRKILHSSSSSSSSSTLSSNLKLLGPNLPDVWMMPSSSSSAFRSQSSANGQTANVINGKSIARAIREGVASEICRMKETIVKSPGLAIVLVGGRRDSQTFIRVKLKACEEVGITTYVEELSEESTEDEVLRVVSRLNNNPSVNGIIVQLPLPQHVDEERIINFVSPEKDVDGFHPLNMGNLAMKGREPLFIPCAPKSCIELLLRCGVEIMGKRAVVVGRSKIVGLPTSLLLQRHHATVSTVHSFTKNPEQITSEADIVIADVGIPNLICGSWLKPGAVVVDMGTNQVQDPGVDQGVRITGDVCFEEAIKVVSAITPVPGGVGPVTIAMLLSNTLDSAKRAFGFI